MTDLPTFTDLTSRRPSGSGQPFDHCAQGAAWTTCSRPCRRSPRAPATTPIDDRWPDLSEAGRLDAARLLCDRHERRCGAGRRRRFPRTKPSTAASCSRRSTGCDSRPQTLRDEAWDPLTYVLVLGSGLHELLAREFAPWRHRGAAFLWRARAACRRSSMPRGRTSSGCPTGPSALLQTETAIEQLSGITGARRRGPRRGAPSGRTGRHRHPRRDSRRCVPRSSDALTPSVGTSRTSSAARRAARAAWVPTSSPPSSVTRSRATCRSRTSGHGRERDFEAVRGELVRVARELVAGVHRQRAGAATTTTRSCARRWLAVAAAPSRAPMACSTSAAARRPPSRPSCARPASSGCPTRRCASPGHRSSCGRTAAPSCRRLGRSIVA